MKGLVIDTLYVEPGVSGGIPFAARPEGGKVWSRLVKGDCVVAAKLDRMFRSARDCLAVVEGFKAKGVSLYLLDLNGGADDVSGDGIARLFLTIVSAFAEFERARIGERIRATKHAQAGRGEYMGGTPPFGFHYDGGVLVRDRVQQDAIGRMVEMRDAGLSFRAIADQITADGIKISHAGVQKVLAREAV